MLAPAEMICTLSPLTGLPAALVNGVSGVFATGYGEVKGDVPLYGPNGPLTPYTNAAGKPINGDSVQIISAGANKLFGPGWAWTPGSGGYEPGRDGADDMANFNGGAQLGVNP